MTASEAGNAHGSPEVTHDVISFVDREFRTLARSLE